MWRLRRRRRATTRGERVAAYVRERGQVWPRGLNQAPMKCAVAACRSSRRDSESRGWDRDRDRERGNSHGRRRRRDRNRDGSAEMSATRTVCIKVLGALRYTVLKF